MAIRVTPLPDNPHFQYKANIKYSDLVTLGGAATTVVIPIIDAPVGLVVLQCALNLITAFDASDASINSLLAEVGDDGDTDRFLSQTECAVDGTEVLAKVMPNSVDTMPYAYLVANAIDIKFTVAGGGSPLLSELTSGEVEVYLQVCDLNQFEGN